MEIEEGANNYADRQDPFVLAQEAVAILNKLSSL